jgi:hypothetical protein
MLLTEYLPGFTLYVCLAPGLFKISNSSSSGRRYEIYGEKLWGNPKDFRAKARGRLTSADAYLSAHCYIYLKVAVLPQIKLNNRYRSIH